MECCEYAASLMSLISSVSCVSGVLETYRKSFPENGLKYLLKLEWNVVVLKKDLAWKVSNADEWGSMHLRGVLFTAKEFPYRYSHR